MLITLGYGALLTISVLLAYFSCAWLHGAYSYSDILNLYESNSDILHQAQTMAFTSLAIGELFHMLGMSDIHHSVFRLFKKKNWMMAIAFFVGIILQLLVIEVPGVNTVFNTANLDWQEWLITAAMALIPLILHEIIVFIRFIKKKIINNKK